MVVPQPSNKKLKTSLNPLSTQPKRPPPTNSRAKRSNMPINDKISIIVCLLANATPTLLGREWHKIDEVVASDALFLFLCLLF